MTAFLMNIVLALGWVALTGNFSAGTFTEGFVVGFFVLWVTARVYGQAQGYVSKVPQAVGFIGFFIKELLLSNLKIAFDVLTPTHRMKPAILAVPLEARTDEEITLLANLITLTPGTLSLAVSPDRKYLYVHAMYVDDVEKAKLSIKRNFEHRILELLR